jgi:predicted RNA-binding Zn-ribbon protein involved in translation (DUF1610 family)|tara:strand:+ start:33368 stop:33706 length:339 start_codon:yes stop_codon:yes gene_type:complete
MGSQIIATCKCGLNTVVSVGGGRYSSKEIYYVPCLCTHCNSVVQVNFLDKSLACLDCGQKNAILYYKTTLEEKKGEKIIFQRDKNLLTDGTYFCPNCERVSLRFQVGNLLWD